MVSIVDGDTITISFQKRLDATNSEDALAQISPALDSLNKSIILDMSELEYISSAGLQVILHCAKAAQQAGSQAGIRGMNDNVREILKISGFLTFLKEV